MFRLANEAALKAIQNRMQGKPEISAIPAYGQKSGNKFHNVICEADNIKFGSKKERAHYLLLKAMQSAGEIKYFIRQVPFDLPGHFENGRVIRHFVDFGVCQKDGSFRWVEVKGRDLGMGKLKRAQVEEIYKIKIEVI